MYDLLPRAGYTEDPKAPGGAMAAAEGLRAFVLKHRTSYIFDLSCSQA